MSKMADSDLKRMHDETFGIDKEKCLWFANELEVAYGLITEGTCEECFIEGHLIVEQVAEALYAASL